MGGPDGGKSTGADRRSGQGRLRAGPGAGSTRDSIAIDWDWKGRAVRLVDTAGMRRRARVTEKVEGLSVADSLRSLRYAHVVVLVLDAEAMLEQQDLTIARRVVDEGRALVIAAHKWDAVQDKTEAVGRLRDRLETSLTQVKGLPVITVSALQGRNLDRLMDAVVGTYDIWTRRVPTAALNRWLAEATDRHPPPAVAGRRIRLRYATQVKARPPTFALFASKPADLPDSYLRYLENGLREAFDMPGVPLRLMLRKGKNPYADQKGR